MTGSSLQAVVLGSPLTGTSTLFSILDVLAAVGRDWEMLHGLTASPPTFDARLLTRDGKPYKDLNGRRVTPDGSLATCKRPQLVIVPDLHLDPSGPIPTELAPLTRWLTEAHEAGALITSVCSGSLLLAATGLLDGENATTHWGYADMFQRCFPAVRLRRERILVPAGEGHRIVTAGGASAWADLLLYLISRLESAEAARQLAKVYLLEPHQGGQLCYASLAARRQHEDQLVAAAQVWAAEHYDASNPVKTMAANSGLSERGFLRRFKRATGQSPVEYIQTLRVEEAKLMLEVSDVSVEQIAAEVGYSEPSSFRTAFRKLVGMPASSYRKKWQRVSLPR